MLGLSIENVGQTAGVDDMEAVFGDADAHDKKVVAHVYRLYNCAWGNEHHISSLDGVFLKVDDAVYTAAFHDADAVVLKQIGAVRGAYIFLKQSVGVEGNAKSVVEVYAVVAYAVVAESAEHALQSEALRLFHIDWRFVGVNVLNVLCVMQR